MSRRELTEDEITFITSNVPCDGSVKSKLAHILLDDVIHSIEVMESFNEEMLSQLRLEMVRSYNEIIDDLGDDVQTIDMLYTMYMMNEDDH